jgi:hypothetical protein
MLIPGDSNSFRLVTGENSREYLIMRKRCLGLHSENRYQIRFPAGILNPLSEGILSFITFIRFLKPPGHQGAEFLY